MTENIYKAVSDIHKIINSYFKKYDDLPVICGKNPVNKQTNKYFTYINVNGKKKRIQVIKKNKRKRKLFNNQLANIILQKNFSGKSYDNIVTTLKLDYDLKISKTAIIQKRTLNPDILSKLNELLLTYIYNDNKPRIIAVDGSQVNLPKELHNSGFKLSDIQLVI